MPTGTAGTNARVYPTQQSHYLYKDLVFGDDAVQKVVGTVPANAIIIAVKVAVTVAFTDGTTDFITVGTVADPDGLADDVDVSSIGVKLSTTLATSDDFFFTADTVIVAQYDGATSDMAAGACTVIVEYIVKH